MQPRDNFFHCFPAQASAQPIRMRFAGPRVNGAEGVRVRIGDAVVTETDGFTLTAVDGAP